MRRGNTLIEILVVCLLMGLVLGVAYDLMLPIMHMWQVNQARADVEQTGLIIETKLRNDLAPSDCSTITSIASPPAVSFMEIGTPGYDPTSGKPLWQQFVAYYLDTENQILYRKTWPVSGKLLQTPIMPYVFPTTTAHALTSSQLAQLVTTENGTEARAAWYVNRLTVTPGAPLQLDVQLVNGTETAERQLSLELLN